MITDDLKNKTMSAMEWVNLLNSELKFCHLCGGMSYSVTDAEVPEWAFHQSHLFPTLFTTRTYNTEAVIGGVDFAIKKACFSCVKKIQEIEEAARIKLEETERLHAAGIFYDYGNEWHDCHTRPTTINKTGYVYVCKVLGRESVYKIGATVGINGVKGRINAQKDLSLDGFVCSLETKDPFGLEKFLHNRFYKSRAQNANTTEWFEIDHQGIAFIKAMRQYNGKDITVKEVIT